MSKRPKPPKDKLSAALPSGRRSAHGGYTYLTQGKLPQHRKYIESYLTACRAGLIADIGGTEEGLSTSQIILIDRAIGILGVLRCVEEFIRDKTSIMEGDDLTACLRHSYLSYNNTLRLTLLSLGIDKRMPETQDLKAYIKSEYGDEEDNGKANAD